MVAGTARPGVRTGARRADRSALVNKREVIRAVARERARTLALLRPLPPERFDAPTALPGWRVREVVAHLISVDRAAVTGAIVAQVFASMEKLERWNDRQVGRWSEGTTVDLLLALDRWGRRFGAFARALPAPLYRLRMPSMLGGAPGGMLIWIRAYDEWVHRQDIRRALGMEDEEVDVEPVAEFLLEAIATSTVPKVEGAVGRVAIALDQVAVPEWGYDLASGAAGPEVAAGAEARIHAGPGFIMAAAGRDRFDKLEERGVLKIEGDEAPARRLLEKLRIV